MATLRKRPWCEVNRSLWDTENKRSTAARPMSSKSQLRDDVKFRNDVFSRLLFIIDRLLHRWGAHTQLSLRRRARMIERPPFNKLAGGAAIIDVGVAGARSIVHFGTRK
jgi:hypothetical protein